MYGLQKKINNILFYIPLFSIVISIIGVSYVVACGYQQDAPDAIDCDMQSYYNL